METSYEVVSQNIYKVYQNSTFLADLTETKYQLRVNMPNLAKKCIEARYHINVCNISDEANANQYQ